MADNSSVTIITASLSAATVLIAWIFRYKIAELAKSNRQKAPNEVLFDGYEKLLKSYQEGIRERDVKITKLEESFLKMQTDLDNAREIIREMKDQDRKKDRIIFELETKLAELKEVHLQESRAGSSI